MLLSARGVSHFKGPWRQLDGKGLAKGTRYHRAVIRVVHRYFFFSITETGGIETASPFRPSHM